MSCLDQAVLCTPAQIEARNTSTLAYATSVVANMPSDISMEEMLGETDGWLDIVVLLVLKEVSSKFAGQDQSQGSAHSRRAADIIYTQHGRKQEQLSLLTGSD